MKKKLLAIIAITVASIAIPSALLAWGPERPLYTMEKPAYHITFNSITNSPAQGDERNFVQIREASASDTAYTDSVSLTAGKEYEVYVYYHNNAATSTELKATDTYVKFELPSKVDKGNTSTKAVGYVGASNASPKEVWDDITFSNATDSDMLLSYIAGSSTIHNKGTINGQAVADTIVTTGAPIGYNAIDGIVPACSKFSGFVTFRIRADQPSFSIDKQVHKTGATGWKETESVNPGDSVDFLVTYTNSGSTTQQGVIIKDVLPKGLTYTAGSTYVSKTKGSDGTKVADGIIADFINIGDYTSKSSAYIKFSATVDKNDNLEKCGLNTLTNTASVQTKDGTKSDIATVTVTKNCEVKKVIYTCNKLNFTKTGDKTYKFTTAYTLENAALSNITYVVKDSKGEVIKTETGSEIFNYTIGNDSKYSVQSTINAIADGKAVSSTNDNCIANIAVEVVPPVTPTQLPVTGMGEVAVSVLGLGSLVASAGYYINSRRALLGR